MIEKRKKQLRSLIRFHSASKINNYTAGGGGGVERRKERKQNKTKESTEQFMFWNKCCCCITAVRVLSLTGNHSPPHLPRMPSNTVLTSGPAVGAAQILI